MMVTKEALQYLQIILYDATASCALVRIAFLPWSLLSFSMSATVIDLYGDHWLLSGLLSFRAVRDEAHFPINPLNVVSTSRITLNPISCSPIMRIFSPKRSVDNLSSLILREGREEVCERCYGSLACSASCFSMVYTSHSLNSLPWQRALYE